MNDFNLIYLIATNLLNQKNLQSAQKNQNAASQTNFQNAQSAQNQTAQNLYQTNNQYLSQNFQSTSQFQLSKSSYNQIFETSTLQNIIKTDAMVTTKYLQSVLELPENLNLFFEKAQNVNSSEKLAKLIVENLLDTTKLATLLNENSKNAIDKVLKAISASINSANTEITQLKEVLNILKSIHQATSSVSSPADSSLASSSSVNSALNNAIKELLLLYIPLNIQAYENTINQGLSEEEAGVISNCDMAIFFETLNFQSIYASIIDNADSFYVTLYMNKIFPKEKFERVVKISAQKLNISYELEYKQKRDNNVQNDIQNFKVFSNAKVSINMLYLAHILIKIIFKIDEDFSLIEKNNVI